MLLCSWIGDRFKCYMFEDMDGVAGVTFQNKLFQCYIYKDLNDVVGVTCKIHMFCTLFGFTIFC